MRTGRTLVLGGLACLTLAWRPGPPRLMWNATASVPIGLYGLSRPARLAVGDLVVAAPPAATASLLAHRGWLPPDVPLLKPVAALEGQVVCRKGPMILVDGTPRARARNADRQGRPLPSWSGCRRLESDEVFLLSSAATDSFDGRYMGVVPRTAILARATPLWRPPSGPGRGRPGGRS